jgi:ribosomal protein L7/L12
MPTSRVIALEWGVVPRAPAFLAIMAVHTPVESAEIVRDYTGLGAMVQHEQESRLLELAENGRVMDAIRLARSLYGYDLTEAKQFVDGLAGRAKA